ncbi:MAG: type II toxin-antitoxin system VapC family toxin [Planctomycetes bacterium]|nr:type II toxin-antitoxin system VapC family toxin [Planctomycetota bacterium]
MNGVLLDTSGYAHLMKGHPGISEAVAKADRIVLNPIVIGELFWAFRGSRQRKRNEGYLASFLARTSVDQVDIDGLTAERYAHIKDSVQEAGTPVPTGDLWIAASAMQHGLAVITTDSDFLRIPQILVHHFEAPGGRPLLRPRRARASDKG